MHNLKQSELNILTKNYKDYCKTNDDLTIKEFYEIYSLEKPIDKKDLLHEKQGSLF